MIRARGFFRQEPARVDNALRFRDQVGLVDLECLGRISASVESDLAGACQQLEKFLNLCRRALFFQSLPQPVGLRSVTPFDCERGVEASDLSMKAAKARVDYSNMNESQTVSARTRILVSRLSE